MKTRVLVVSEPVITAILSKSKGAIAITVANPTDLVKVRLQAEGKLPVGVARRYAGALQAYYAIVKQVIFVTVISGCSICLPTHQAPEVNRKEWQLCGQGLDQTLQEMRL